MKKTHIAFSAALFLAGCSGSRHAEKSPHQTAEMSQSEMMQLFEEAATPAEQHRRLEPLVGEWKVVSRFWVKPGEAPMIEKGRATHKWVLGKRFLKQRYKGRWNGQPYRGMGFLGYDKVQKAYVANWIDSAGTGIMRATGEFNTASDSLELITQYYCPVVGGLRRGRSVTKIISDDKHIYEMYDAGPDGTEMKVMEIIYTRR